MRDKNEDFWTERYKNNEIGWDLGQISPPLKAYLEQLSDKNLKILIPGAGNSYEAEYLNKNGFNNVTVIDLSILPLQNLQTRVPNFPTNNLLHQNFFQHNDKYDLILEQTFFCAIPPAKRKEYVEKMYSLLKFDGKLVGVLFNREFEKAGPPFGGNEKEYRELFKESFKILQLENCYNSVEPRKGSELFFIFKKSN